MEQFSIHDPRLPRPPEDYDGTLHDWYPEIKSKDGFYPKEMIDFFLQNKPMFFIIQPRRER